MASRDDIADQTYEAADIGECTKADGSGQTMTQQDFRNKVKNDEAVHGHHAEQHENNMAEQDNGDDDWDKVNHFSAVAVNQHKNGH
ncbi:hypothetical protein PG991_014052 [Apiospora marii]|uniref:Uncharacterized protein n=1 Tax=Apiospora marii TaxID=335849 RepID=A0ABR1R8P9_9PEZI